MPYGVLTVSNGPEAGREILVPTGLLMVGIDADEPGRIDGPGIVARHAQFAWAPEEAGDRADFRSLFVSPLDGSVSVDGDPVSSSVYVHAGSTLTLGSTNLAFSVNDGVHPQVQARLAGLEAAAAGDGPYRCAVNFEADGGAEQHEILEAGADHLGLIGADGVVHFRVPISDLGEISYPKLRNSAIHLSALGVHYELSLLQVVWVAGGVDWQSATAGRSPDDLMNPQPGQVHFEDITMYRGLAGAFQMAQLALDVAADRAERRRWRKILDGEERAEDVAARRARSLLDEVR